MLLLSKRRSAAKLGRTLKQHANDGIELKEKILGMRKLRWPIADLRRKLPN